LADFVPIRTLMGAISGSLDSSGGVLDFYVRPHFTPLILNPTTGAVVSG
jgi:hypothetical protein